MSEDGDGLADYFVETICFPACMAADACKGGFITPDLIPPDSVVDVWYVALLAWLDTLNFVIFPSAGAAAARG